MKQQNSDFNKNTWYFVFILFLVVFVLLFRLFFVQIVYHKAYLSNAKLNASKSMPIVAPRGMIYDRYGKVLVANKAVFSVYVLQTYVKDKEQLFKSLSKILSMPYSEISKIVSSKKSRPFDPILIKQNVPKEIVAKIEEDKDNLAGVVINVRPIRFYPNGKYAAHLLGYIGEVSAKEIEQYSSLNLRQGDLIGKTGIEKFYDTYLRGINGGERISISSFGKPSDEKGFDDPFPGNNLRLTIDIDLQKAVEDSLKSLSGAVVVLDVSNGDVLALASSPTYDPNIFSAPISIEKWKQLHSGNKPFFNRAISAFPSGSIFKVVTMSAALENKSYFPNSMFFCPGYVKLGSRTFKCWKTEGHGHISLFEGLIQSCNVVFYETGLKLGPDILSYYAKKFGLGEKTGIDLPNESAGVVPSPSWKKEILKENWYPGDSLNFGIGQGFLNVTPLQMTNLYSLIANRGNRYQPHLLLEIKRPDGSILYSYEPKTIGTLPISEKNIEIVRDALHQVVLRGTGRNAFISSFEAAGKTGTAQNPSGKPHAWFMCFAPYQNPKIAVGIFVEHGEHGDKIAAQTAHQILEWYYFHRVEHPKNVM